MGNERWSHKSAQPYQWISCAQIRPDLSRKQEQRNEQKSQKKPSGSLQGQSRIKGRQGGADPYELAPRLDLHPNQITPWKNQLLDRATEVLAKSSKPADPPIDVKTLQAKIGQLSLENYFLAGGLTKAGLLSSKR